MVGFISAESAIEEEDLSRAPKEKSSSDPSPPVDQKTIDLSLADTFLDFDSIKEWFERFPDDSGGGQEPGEFFMAEMKDDKPLVDEVCVKSEPMSYDETQRASALADVVGDIKTDASLSLVKGEVASDVENERSASVSGLDGQKSEDVVNGEKGEDMSDAGSESSSESESSDSSSSSSSSSSDDEDSSDEDDEDEHLKEIKTDDVGEMEEGEIREANLEKMSVRSNEVDDDDDDGMDDGLNADHMVSWSDVEDGDATGGGGGPIRSKNEVKVLPPVPRVEAKLEPNHQMSPVGVVLSVLGAQVIVEGAEKHTPLNEGSILWITERRAPLGIIDEIFGPVKNPYYMVRYNSEDEVPSGISQGSLISFVPEFASYILSEKNLYKKGYDASGENDEEISDEAEFSDDEKEAEFRRMQRMAKRGATDPNDMKGVNRKYFGKKGREREGRWKKNNNNGNPSSPQMRPFPNPQNQNTTNSVPSSSVSPGFIGGPGAAPPFLPPPQPGSSVPAATNGAWMNGNFPSPQQIGALLANAFPNGMQWASQGNQFPYQMPSQNPLLVPNMVMPNIGQSHPLGGPPFAPWPGHMVQNASNNQTFGMGFQQMPPFNGGAQGIHRNGSQIDPSAAPHGNNDAPGMFNPGASFARGGNPPPNRRGGGRFTGNRGRQHFK